MNMFARLDKNPAMTLQDKQNVTDGPTDGCMDRQRENSIPTTNKVCGGYKNKVCGGYNELIFNLVSGPFDALKLLWQT